MQEPDEIVLAVDTAAARRRAALLSADVDTLRQLMRADMNYLHSDGAPDTRDLAVANVANGTVVYSGIEESDVRFVVANDSVVLRAGNVVIDAEVAGVPKRLVVAFTEVWAQGGSCWQLVSWQSTPRL